MANYSNFPSIIGATQSGQWIVNLAPNTVVGLTTGSTVGLNAGTNNIGSVNAIQSGTWNFSFTPGSSFTALPNYLKSGVYNLTTPGTQTAGLAVAYYTRITCQYTIANIGTNVVVRLEGSADGSNWSQLAADDLDTTRTANGSYMFIVNNVALTQVRLNWVSATGGTPTINAVFNCS